MKLKFNRNRELEVVGLGVFGPGQFVVADDKARAKKYLDSGYFDKIKERKRKDKNLKRKELKNNATRSKRTYRN